MQSKITKSSKIQITSFSDSQGRTVEIPNYRKIQERSLMKFIEDGVIIVTAHRDANFVEVHRNVSKASGSIIEPEKKK